MPLKDSTALSRVPTSRPVCTRTRMDWVAVAEWAAVSGCAAVAGCAALAGCAAMVAIAQAVATIDGSETAALGGIALDCRIEGCPIEPRHVAGFFWITGPPRPRQFDT